MSRPDISADNEVSFAKAMQQIDLGASTTLRRTHIQEDPYRCDPRFNFGGHLVLFDNAVWFCVYDYLSCCSVL